MRILYFILMLLFTCCKQKKNNIAVTKSNNIPQKEKSVFFPVTSYIKGQIFEIKNIGVNPLKVVGKIPSADSTWIQIENLEKELNDFLTPEIDTANFTSLFSEKKFMDQTLDAITLTYDPIKILPDAFALRHWDVYIDPNTNAVIRIYIVKKLPAGKTIQLTWQSDKWCRMITIANSEIKKSFIEKDITIKWDF